MDICLEESITEPKLLYQIYSVFFDQIYSVFIGKGCTVDWASKDFWILRFQQWWPQLPLALVRPIGCPARSSSIKEEEEEEEDDLQGHEQDKAPSFPV